MALHKKIIRTLLLCITISVMVCIALMSTACGEEKHTLTKVAAKSATCTEDGNLEYWVCDDCGKVFSDEAGKVEAKAADFMLPATGHDWDVESAVWEWEEYNSATVTFTCRHDATHTDSVTAEAGAIADETLTAATCAGGGKINHTATVVFEKQTFTDTVTEITAPLGHEWDTENIDWNWTGYGSATATFVCKRDGGHIQTVDAAVSDGASAPASCTENGYRKHIATVTFNNNTYTDEKTETVTSVGHKFADGVCTVCGAEQVSEGLEFKLSNDGSYYTLVGMGTCRDSEVYVPAFYNGIPVKSIAGKSNGFSGADFIKKIVIPDSVTSIGQGALSNCKTIEEITVPFIGDSKKTSTDLNQYTFGYIFSSYTLHDGWISVKTGYVQSVNESNGWPTVVKPENGMTFYLPGTLKKVTVTGGIVMHSAFRGFSMLEEVVLPSDIDYIGGYAFAGCSSLKSIVIPSTVKAIHDYAFQNCKSLKTLTIPDSVESMGTEWSGGENILSGCMGLESLTIPFVGSSKDDALPLFGSIFGSPDDTVSSDSGYYAEQKYDSSGKNAPAFLPNSLKIVTVTGGNLSQYGVFYGCEFDTLIVKSVECDSIGAYAFYTGSVTSVVLPATVKKIQTGAFTDTALRYVYFGGTEEQYDITVVTVGDGNKDYVNAEVLYYSEKTPSGLGNYWHYVDGVPTAW